MICRSPKLLALCGGAVIACTLDNRVLNGTDSPCLEMNECVEVAGSSAAGKAAAGSSSNAGGSARGGASSTTGGSGSVAGLASDGGEAGEVQVGPTPDCPDLDQNTVLDCTETLVDNAGFASNIKGWAPEASGAITWESLDAWGSNTSGSIRIENRGTANGPDNGLIYTGATQCVKVQEDHTYVIFAQMYARGPTVTSYGSVVGRVFASKDCSGTPLHVETSAIEGTVNLWITLRATVPAVTSAGSMLVELSVGKPTSVTGAAALNFDNVLVR
jgi:hypothetical protein